MSNKDQSFKTQHYKIMGRKQGKKGKKGNNKTVVKSSKIVKSSFASSSRQQTNSETKSIDNNERSNEKDSCSKTSTSDIFSSLFGSGTNVTTSNTNDLFSLLKNSNEGKEIIQKFNLILSFLYKLASFVVHRFPAPVEV